MDSRAEDRFRNRRWIQEQKMDSGTKTGFKGKKLFVI